MAIETPRNQRNLNNSMPAAKDAMLGDTLADLIAQHNALLADVAAMRTAMNTNIVLAATLAIKAGSGVLVKTTSQVVGKVDGTVVNKAANTDMAALVGVVAAGKSALFPFYLSSANALSTGAKTADAVDADAATLLLPATPTGKILIGWIVVTNGSADPFTGNTTALDAADITVSYVNASTTATFSDALVAVDVTDIESR